MQEVGGSIPPGSTSLRSLRELRLGKPREVLRSKASEGCLVVARQGESLDYENFYVGVTDDLRARLAKHNAGEVPHTSKYRPWRLRTYTAFDDEGRAVAFEKYLKSGSGRAFAKSVSEPTRLTAPRRH